jgi:hypothetical protein
MGPEAACRAINGMKRGKLFLFPLTEKALYSPEALGQLWVAFKRELHVVPIKIDGNFHFPTDSYYDALTDGEIITAHGPLEKLELQSISGMVRGLFDEIALIFDANDSAAMIAIYSKAIVERSKVGIGMRRKPDAFGQQISSRQQISPRTSLSSDGHYSVEAHQTDSMRSGTPEATATWSESLELPSLLLPGNGKLSPRGLKLRTASQAQGKQWTSESSVPEVIEDDAEYIVSPAPSGPAWCRIELKDGECGTMPTSPQPSGGDQLVGG